MSAGQNKDRTINPNSGRGLGMSGRSKGLAAPQAWDGHHIGAALKTERLAQGISLETASADLKIQSNYLRALEKLDPQALPSMGYVLGFVRSYAGYLGMDASLAVNRYKTEIDGPKKTKTRFKSRQASGKSFFNAKFNMVAGTVLSCAFVVVGWYGFKPDANSAQITTRPSAQIMPDTAAAPLQSDLISADPMAIVLKAVGPSWVHVENKDGDVLISRIMVPGEIFETTLDEHPLLSLRDAGAIELYRAGNLVGPIGQKGARGKNIPL